MKLPIPKEALAQHVIALGKTRSGKSSKLRLIVESLLEADKPVCIIDPKGDWWGLKSSADGKSAGYPVVIFGGEHADVPINEHAGAHVAELVATGNRPCIIDLGGWMVGERTRFFIQFASTLFKLTRGHRYLAIDEVHNFCPKGKVLSPEAGVSLHWANRLASEGQGKGLVLVAASQRPQKVHNDFLTSCETLIACRVIHKADRDAIKDWIDGCGDLETGKEVLAGLAGMKRPEAWVWSPEIDFGPKLVTWPFFSTYDSFKPQPANAAKLKGWADVNLDDVRTKLAAVVKQAEENDPVALKRQIQQLRAELSKKAATQKPVVQAAKPPAMKGVPIPAVRKMLNDHERRIQKLRAGIVAVHNGLTVTQGGSQALIELADAALREVVDSASAEDMKAAAIVYATTAHSVPLRESPAPRLHSEVVTMRAPRISRPAEGAAITGLRKRILDALAWLADKGIEPASREATAAVAGATPSGGHYSNTISALKTAGLIEYPPQQPGSVRLTDEGRAHADPGRDTGEIHEKWLQLVSGLKQRILQALVERHPAVLSREELAAAVGAEAGGGHFSNTVSALSTLGAIDYPQKGFVALTKHVMP